MTVNLKFGRKSDECTSSAAFSQSATGSYKTININHDKRSWLESRKRTCVGYIARTGCRGYCFREHLPIPKLKIDSAIKSYPLNQNMDGKKWSIPCWDKSRVLPEIDIELDKKLRDNRNHSITETIDNILVNEIIFFSSQA
jgi:hypothetical protein